MNKMETRSSMTATASFLLCDTDSKKMLSIVSKQWQDHRLPILPVRMIGVDVSRLANDNVVVVESEPEDFGMEEAVEGEQAEEEAGGGEEPEQEEELGQAETVVEGEQAEEEAVVEEEVEQEEDGVEELAVLSAVSAVSAVPALPVVAEPPAKKIRHHVGDSETYAYGDWTCRSCGNHNWAWRGYCNSRATGRPCREPRDVTFRAGDWYCQCGNLNTYGKRTCNMRMCEALRAEGEQLPGQARRDERFVAKPT